MLSLKKQPVKLNLQLSAKVLEKKENKKKVARRSRGKGNRGENGVAEVFNSWYEVPETFAPTSSSGAGRKVGQAGDLLGPPTFTLCVEIKNDESWKLGDLLTHEIKRSHYGKIWDFWKQCYTAWEVYQARKKPFQINKVPALIFTKNYDSIFILILKIDMEQFVVPVCYMTLDNPQFGRFYLMELTEFLFAQDKTAIIK